jgi:Helix-turn-helix domain
MTVESQERRILAYLKRGHVLTPMSAYNLFNCLRLSARIHSLRKRHRIESAICKTPSGKRVSVYSL